MLVLAYILTSVLIAFFILISRDVACKPVHLLCTLRYRRCSGQGVWFKSKFKSYLLCSFGGATGE